MKRIKRYYAEFVDRLAWAIVELLKQRMGMTFQDVLRTNISTSGAELHALLSLRSIREAGKKMRRRIEGDVLEIGGYGQPGLALAFLLSGARKYYLNNICPVVNRMPLAYAQNLYAMMELSLTATCGLSDVIEPIEGTDEVRIKSDRLEVISGLDAAHIALPDGAVDFIFSFAVFEHVKTTTPILSNAFRMLKRNGWCYHAIDLRDHRAFARPLEFLKYTPDEFQRLGSGDSRKRYREHLGEFDRCGYEVDFVEYATPAPLKCSNRMDCFAVLLEGRRETVADRIEDVKVWVTEELRSQFSEEFRSHSLADLSVTGINVGAHKPG